ncbi:unnamed protein product [Meganyctiphanes norvegica]|uniref:XK-related protein n=1 Tax=Meganyctiphanes norvegica TaxID=48144 RepID=A0AAV2SLC4_MEGNR
MGLLSVLTTRYLEALNNTVNSLSKPFNDAVTLSPKPVNNTVTSCPKPLNNIVTRSPEHVSNSVTSSFILVDSTVTLALKPVNITVTTCPELDNNKVTLSSKPLKKKATRRLRKCSKHKWVSRILWSIIGIFFYVSDFGTDINAAVHLFSKGEYVLGSLTVLLTILPMMIPSIVVILHEIQENKNSVKDICLLILAAIVCSPFMPIYLLMTNLISNIRGHGPDSLAARGAGLMKLCEAMVESCPQFGLQMLIIFKDLLAGNAIEAWQWVTIATSLSALAFSVSTSRIFIKANSSSKVIFFIFSMLVTSRCVVSCTFSMIHGIFFMVPIGAHLVVSFIIWMIIRSRCFAMCIPLADSHYSNKISGFILIALSWMLNAAFNSYTLSGLIVSTNNLVFAIGSCFLDLPSHVAITSLSLAAASWAANIIFTFVPVFEGVRRDWLVINEHGESYNY